MCDGQSMVISKSQIHGMKRGSGKLRWSGGMHAVLRFACNETKKWGARRARAPREAKTRWLYHKCPGWNYLCWVRKTAISGGALRKHCDKNWEGGAGQDGWLVHGAPCQVGTHQGLSREPGKRCWTGWVTGARSTMPSRDSPRPV